MAVDLTPLAAELVDRLAANRTRGLTVLEAVGRVVQVSSSGCQFTDVCLKDREWSADFEYERGATPASLTPNIVSPAGRIPGPCGWRGATIRAHARQRGPRF